MRRGACTGTGARGAGYLTDELGLPTAEPGYPLGTFGYYYYFLEVLFRHGRDDLAYELLRRYYGAWVRAGAPHDLQTGRGVPGAGATTFGEHFSLSHLAGRTSIPYEYEVHAYGTSAHLHFYNNILGVRPLEPGFRRLRIAPQPGDLQWARGQLATPLGTVRVAWQVEEGAFALNVELPETCAYEVEPPARYARCQVRVNGRLN